MRVCRGAPLLPYYGNHVHLQHNDNLRRFRHRRKDLSQQFNRNLLYHQLTHTMQHTMPRAQQGPRNQRRSTHLQVKRKALSSQRSPTTQSLLSNKRRRQAFTRRQQSSVQQPTKANQLSQASQLQFTSLRRTPTYRSNPQNRHRSHQTNRRLQLYIRQQVILSHQPQQDISRKTSQRKVRNQQRKQRHRRERHVNHAPRSQQVYFNTHRSNTRRSLPRRQPQGLPLHTQHHFIHPQGKMLQQPQYKFRLLQHVYTTQLQHPTHLQDPHINLLPRNNQQCKPVHKLYSKPRHHRPRTPINRTPQGDITRGSLQLRTQPLQKGPSKRSHQRQHKQRYVPLPLTSSKIQNKQHRLYRQAHSNCTTSQVLIHNTNPTIRSHQRKRPLIQHKQHNSFIPSTSLLLNTKNSHVPRQTRQLSTQVFTRNDILTFRPNSWLHLRTLQRSFNQRPRDHKRIKRQRTKGHAQNKHQDIITLTRDTQRIPRNIRRNSNTTIIQPLIWTKRVPTNRVCKQRHRRQRDQHTSLPQQQQQANTLHKRQRQRRRSQRSPIPQLRQRVRTHHNRKRQEGPPNHGVVQRDPFQRVPSQQAKPEKRQWQAAGVRPGCRVQCCHHKGQAKQLHHHRAHFTTKPRDNTHKTNQDQKHIPRLKLRPSRNTTRGHTNLRLLRVNHALQAQPRKQDGTQSKRGHSPLTQHNQSRRREHNLPTKRRRRQPRAKVQATRNPQGAQHKQRKMQDQPRHSNRKNTPTQGNIRTRQQQTHRLITSNPSTYRATQGSSHHKFKHRQRQIHLILYNTKNRDRHHKMRTPRSTTKKQENIRSRKTHVPRATHYNTSVSSHGINPHRCKEPLQNKSQKRREH